MRLERSFILLGVAFILIGVALILVPFLAKALPAVQVEKIPWLLLYVYRKNGFFFATSPLLFIISLILWILGVLQRRG